MVVFHTFPHCVFLKAKRTNCFCENTTICELDLAKWAA
ncbi:hypothetical protein SB48_HM08orf02104 [Heyndrickxia coagulans]|uniref:Uncharacterized protein n=1 Tax=Heyndrickxia coagulans TaxID=1398 RepID=A0AAN0WBA3_HEYCO|nr:hypothetical protein SB48_HM08orf02104 [Heyndrickxia coagulans]